MPIMGSAISAIFQQRLAAGLPIPKIIKPDPDKSTPVSVTTRQSKLPYNQIYGVYDDAKAPTFNAEIWLWFQATGDPRLIELKHFTIDQHKGDVLFSAKIDTSQKIDKIHRAQDANDFAYFGFYSTSVGTFDDQLYFDHNKHAIKHRKDSRILYPSVITKWRQLMSATISCGTVDRSSNWRSGKLVLEAVVLGTTATSWEEESKVIAHLEPGGKSRGHHIERRTLKFETSFVDTIEYRLILNDELWSEWILPGDSSPQLKPNVVLESPLFRTELIGGFSNPGREFKTKTLPGVDGALAILISHLCCTEFCVDKILSEVKPNTPAVPPHVAVMMEWATIAETTNYEFTGKKYLGPSNI